MPRGAGRADSQSDKTGGPTKLVFELDLGPHRSVQSETDRIRHELVLEALDPEDLEASEVDAHDGGRAVVGNC